jgi:hypothetical protein
MNIENYKTPPHKIQILTLTKNINFKMSDVPAVKAQGYIGLRDLRHIQHGGWWLPVYYVETTRVDVVWNH